MKTSVVGQGAFGIPLAKHLQTNEVCDIKDSATTTLERICEELSHQNPDVIILAISADKQLEDVPKIMENIITKDRDSGSNRKRVFISIASVQTPARNAAMNILENAETKKPVIFVSLHPNFGQALFTEGNMGDKICILTDIQAFGRGDGKNELWKNEVERKLKEKIAELNTKHPEQGALKLIDLRAGNRELGFTGPEYHDYIATYYQALFHMIKLIPGIQATEWYINNFNQVKASDALSFSIIEQNPNALKLYETFKTMIGNSTDIKIILQESKKLFLEGEAKIADEHRILKTPNIKILEKLF